MVRSIGGPLTRIGLLWLGLCATAMAQPAPAADPALPAPPTTPATATPRKPSDAPLPSCLDQTIRDELGAELKPRGVQKRDFAKDGKLVLHGHAGIFGGDLTSSSWIAGGSLGLFFTEDFGIQLELDVTPLELDLDKPLETFFGENRFEPGLAYLGMANLMWSPIHAKLKIGDSIIHSDIMVFAGAGRLVHDSVQGVAVNAGFALDMFVSKVVTIRFDVRDLLTVVEVAGETRYTNNLIATAGFAVWIPVGL